MRDPDLTVIRRRWRASLLPPRPADAKAIQNAALALLPRMQPDGTWPDVLWQSDLWANWPPAEHLRRLHLIARAYALRESAPLAESARRAFDAYRTRNPICKNWWWNEIGSGEYLSEILLFLDQAATPEQFDFVTGTVLPRSKRPGTGANLVWLMENLIGLGVLTDQPDIVADAYRRIYDEIKIVPPGQEGIQTDFSFHQHGAQFYSGGYGVFYGNDCARFASFAWGTRYQIPPERMRILAGYLLDGQQWMIRGEVFDYSAIGREISRRGKVAVTRDWTIGPISPPGAAYVLQRATELLGELPVPRRSEFAELGARLLAGDTPGPPHEVTGNRVFWRSDYLAHRRAGYFASVRMYSSRLLNTENTLGEGKRLHHIADGANFFYRRGDEYRDLFPLWDWRKVPGTTAEQDDPPLSQAGAITRHGQTNFVGGVSDGTYGAAVFDFVRDTLKARKAWFCFDEEIVCLGAGITSDSPWPVATTLNQSWARGAVRTGTAASSAPWFVHDDIAYVVLPGSGVPHVLTETRTGRWSDIGEGTTDPVSGRVFSLHLDHGVRPRDAAYAYIVRPGNKAAIAPTTYTDPARSPVQILANSSSLQAVHHRGVGVLLAAFYEPGMNTVPSLGTFRVDQPCALCTRSQPGNKLRLAVANPRCQPLTVQVQWERPRGSETLRFVLPEGPEAGKSLVREVSG